MYHNKDTFDALWDRDAIATIRTLEEVINLPKTLAEPLQRKARRKE